MHCSHCHAKSLQRSPLNWHMVLAAAFCFLFRPFHFLFGGISGIWVPFETSNPHLRRCCIDCSDFVCAGKTTKASCLYPSRECSLGNSTKLARQRPLQKNEGQGCSLPVSCSRSGLFLEWRSSENCQTGKDGVLPGFVLLSASRCLGPLPFSGSYLLDAPLLGVDGWVDS